MVRSLLIAGFFIALVLPAKANESSFTLTLDPIGRFSSGIYDDGGAEIVAYDALTRRAFVVNAGDATVDVLDLRDPASPAKIGAIDTTAAGPGLAGPNSIAVRFGLLVIAIENDDKQANGAVAFYSAASLRHLRTIEVGALPDMVTFSPNGRYVVVANEGEPNDDYTVDPEGSVTVIDLRRGLYRARVRTAGFKRFNDDVDTLRANGVRIYGPGATVAQDLEPEYITVDSRSRLAYVALQENNAVAVVDLRRARVQSVNALGFKDHSASGNELDASDRDDAINISNWPVFGMYQPDSIESYRHQGRTYLVTANEGDARDYDGFSEESRVKDLLLDADTFPKADLLQEDNAIGRLTVTTALGDPDSDGDFDQLYANGARSFSIWDAHSGAQVFDSGSELEDLTANLLPAHFNATNDDNDSLDNRSDNKGPEPEGLALGRVLGRTYAFVGLERIGGIAVYDISNPHAPLYQSYINTRNFDADVCLQRDDEGDCLTGAGNANPEAGDLGPEGFEFVPWYASPTLRPLLLVGNEVSGTTTIYQVGFRSD